MSMERLKDGMPNDATRAIAIYPDPSDDKTVCRWFGMTREQVATHLYAIADEIVNQLPILVKGSDTKQ